MLFRSLAAFACVQMLGLDPRQLVQAACSFPGLPHRCEWVAEHRGISFINDSKSTNPASTLAAIDGLAGESDGMVLILGGQGKGADFAVLADVISEKVHHVILFGEDKDVIRQSLGEASITLCNGLEEVIAASLEIARTGETVLFSPACASFDLFNNFEHRGAEFSRLVREAG